MLTKLVLLGVLASRGMCTPYVTSGGPLSSSDRLLIGKLSSSCVTAVAASLFCSEMKAAAFLQSEAFILFNEAFLGY